MNPTAMQTPPRHPRLLFIVTALDVGGAERYLLRLVRFLGGLGWRGRIDVLCQSGREGTMAAEYRDAGARVIPLRVGYFNPLSWHRLENLISRGNYQAVCDFAGDFAGIPLWMAARAGVGRRVAFYRGSTHHFKTDRLRMGYWRWVHHLTLRHATSLLSNSLAAFDFFHPGWRAAAGQRFDVIPNGIDAAEFDVTVDRNRLRAELGIPAGARVVGHVGRYNAAKNHPALIAAAGLLSARRADVVFLLCGRGVRENLVDVVAGAGLAGQVILHENREDVPQVLQCMDAFFFPSLTEGQPNALLEAILAGLPFVASDIPPHGEALPHWLHDRLVPADDIAAAVDQLAELLESSDAERERTTRAAAWARETYAPARCFGAVLPHLGVATGASEELPVTPAAATNEIQR